jgi:RNA polymerase sigma-70 factor (ECF subfamily)
MEARSLIEGLEGERDRFVRLARSRVATDADAEDVVQRAMMRAAERASQIEDPARWRAWFYRILHRTLLDHHRRPRRERSMGLMEDEPAPERDAGSSGACCCAPRLLAEIRPAYAEVLRRVDWEGEDPSSAASALGVSSTNLYVRLHRARAALKDRVQRHCGVASITPCLDCSCGAEHRCG